MNTKPHSTSRESSVCASRVRTSETSVDNHFTRQYNPEDNSEYLSSTEKQQQKRKFKQVHESCRKLALQIENMKLGGGGGHHKIFTTGPIVPTYAID
jgi:hypothetical protein